MHIRVYQTPLAAGLELPKKAHDSDWGFDLATAIDFTVGPGESVKVPTGLVIDMPTARFEIGGAFFRIALVIEQRTGNGGRGLYPAATIVDAGYRPERDDQNGLTLFLRNVGNDVLEFKRGDRVMQGLFQLFPDVQLIPSDASRITWTTDRGSKRFGETGR